MVSSSFPLILPRTPSFSPYLLLPLMRKQDNFYVFKKYGCCPHIAEERDGGDL
jgi:hypothetical protein